MLVPCLFGLLLGLAMSVRAQEPDSYVRGSERKRLTIDVRILGEVRTPGEYNVPDDTDVLGLLAKAGGPTEFGDITAIHLTHQLRSTPPVAGASQAKLQSSHEMVDIKSFLLGKPAAPLPILQPGDVVSVPRNSWWKWRTFAAVLRDLSVVASAVFLGIRAFNP